MRCDGGIGKLLWTLTSDVTLTMDDVYLPIF